MFTQNSSGGKQHGFLSSSYKPVITQYDRLRTAKTSSCLPLLLCCSGVSAQPTQPTSSCPSSTSSGDANAQQLRLSRSSDLTHIQNHALFGYTVPGPKGQVTLFTVLIQVKLAEESIEDLPRDSLILFQSQEGHQEGTTAPPPGLESHQGTSCQSTTFMCGCQTKPSPLKARLCMWDLLSQFCWGLGFPKKDRNGAPENKV